MNLSLGWFMDAVLTGVSLAGADLYRANCERADMDCREPDRL